MVIYTINLTGDVVYIDILYYPSFRPISAFPLRPHVSHTIVDSQCSIVGEIRLNADGFHSSHHLTFSYAICGHVDAYNQVYSPEGYQIDYFPPFPAHLIWLVGINIKRNTHE
jgi:hypothetical protein